eukprot:EG_transcript_21925
MRRSRSLLRAALGSVLALAIIATMQTVVSPLAALPTAAPSFVIARPKQTNPRRLRYIAPSPPPVIPMHAKRYSMELSDGHTAERQWTAGDNNPKANALPGPPMLKRQVPPSPLFPAAGSPAPGAQRLVNGAVVRIPVAPNATNATAQPPKATVATPAERAKAPTAPAAQPAKPLADTAAAQPAKAPAAAAAEPAKAAAEPAKITTEPAKAATEPVKAAAEPTKAATEPAKATGEPAKAATEPVKAAAEPTKAATEPAKATGEPAKAATEPVKAAAEPTKAATEP